MLCMRNDEQPLGFVRVSTRDVIDAFGVGTDQN